MPASQKTRSPSTVRRVAPPSRASRLASGSARLIADAVAALARHPVRHGGIAGFVLVFSAVAANALYEQPGAHPAPLLVTRGLAVRAPDVEAAAMARLRDVQALLAKTGHYAAAIDGRPGPATTTAIKTFQIENGLVADGQLSPELADEIRRVALVAPQPRPYGEASEEGRGGRVVETVDALQVGEIVDAAPVGEMAGAELVRRIQAGLTAANVADLAADGIPGERTRAAIRTFEALEGMDVTGEPDRRVLERLVAIGAV